MKQLAHQYRSLILLLFLVGLVFAFTLVNSTPLFAQTPPVHVGDLDSEIPDAGRGRWSAKAVITVHDANHEPVNNATVNGSWIWGRKGESSGSCVTNGSGQCSITRNNLQRNNPLALFTVTSVTAPYDYDAGANHDPDGDSNGTTIIVLSPYLP